MAKIGDCLVQSVEDRKKKVQLLQVKSLWIYPYAKRDIGGVPSIESFRDIYGNIG